VSGALKDYRRAIVVGDDHTYGKGTVQNVEDLPPGYGAVKVTTAMFFRPGGESTQNRGVDADIVFPSVAQAQDWGEKSMPFALPPARRPQFLSSSVVGEGFSPVTAEGITKVARYIADRVAKSDEFKRIRERMERQRRNKGMVKVADLMDDAEEEKARKGAGPNAPPSVADADEEDEDEARRKRGELTPHGREALAVLSAYAGCGVVRPCK
jgi:carboxyl-terminal processing protease